MSSTPVRNFGFCAKCGHRVTIPGKEITTKTVAKAQCQELVGCKIEKNPMNGTNCPLIRDIQDMME